MMKTKLLTFAALALVFGPSVASAHPVTGTTVHQHAAVAHDRSPHIHERGPVAHH